MIIIPREFEFEGSGHKGAAFEQKGMEERNLTNLLKVLSDKTTQKSIESLAKIDKTEWKDIALVAVSLRSVVEGGGLGAVFGSITATIRETIELQIESLMAPLTNEVTAAINEILAPFITELLTPIINDLTTFFTENAVGTGVGGIAGGVIGAFLGSPAIGAMIGASVGAGIEAYYKWLDTIIPDETQKGSVTGWLQWREENKNGIFYPSLADYKKWLDEQNASNNSYVGPSPETGLYGR